MREFDEHLNSLYFVLNPLCNLGFFMLICTIFLANLDVLQVYEREMEIGARTRTFWSELTEAENYGQQAGTAMPTKNLK